MNKKLKEQLELVIMQCSALKASLDESLVRNKQYETEIANLRRELAETENVTDTAPQKEETIVEKPAGAPETVAVEETPEPASEEPTIEETAEQSTPATKTPGEQTEVAIEEADEQIPRPIFEEPVAEQKEEQPTEAKELPAKETAPEMQSFQSTLEMGADMVSQAVASSKEYIARLEASHPEGCSSLTDIIRSRTDLFKVEISGIIGGAGSLTEKREKMNNALIKLIQYFENVK